ncbi:GNAT family N-acetyltransferase [Staphylococcus pasteuri]|uniref:Predicted N-acetyltransferase YhbS n=1 Tax=Staphylococcus pasteuri TaxID=45972 RepID=A0ABY1H481_9STAP|nr:N-acetyltransferase [Staphylococcus pasteuri]ATH63510.1 GNAT family N-acetyltransferase [Staphylococcus pasteuri]KKI55894.1 Acetyltransferase (GNAT) family protein [Staphylococcus pasteuri]MCF7599489.1 N-acetyltransferase [Staphylococcus pasteuri]MDI3231944.1 N-acetyltransferase [Staphylococcus pasteuri]MEB6209092.1 N-acetyltransferase [Staphylococcus pasteuri]
MQIYLSTLTEVDYEESLNSIEENYDDQPETSWQEKALVKKLRKSDDYNYELEVIAKNEQNKVIGHALLIEVSVTSEEKKYTALTIASLSVKKELRNQGLGKALVQAVEERAKSQDYTTIVVDREQVYFKKLGYQLASEFGLYSEYGDESQPLLVKFLWDNLIDPPIGKVKYPSIMR